jgi:hypothetical protein
VVFGERLDEAGDDADGVGGGLLLGLGHVGGLLHCTEVFRGAPYSMILREHGGYPP